MIDFRYKPTTKKMEFIIEQVYDESLWVDEVDGKRRKVRYDPDTASMIVARMSDLIKDKLRDLHFPNYKYFVQVFIGEKKDQSVCVADRHLLDEKVDCFASVSLQGDTFFCTTMTYGIQQS